MLYNQLGLGRLVEYIQLGLLDTSKVITMKVGIHVMTHVT